MQQKRDVSVTIKMTPKDWDCFKKCAGMRWPDAVLTQSGILLGLARIGAASVLAGGPTKKKR